MRPASLPLPLRVPCQGLACGAGSWLAEGVSDPAALPSQYLLGHWFLSLSLPQIFIADLLLPLDCVDAPQAGVEECLDLLLHRLCCPPCLTSTVVSTRLIPSGRACLGMPVHHACSTYVLSLHPRFNLWSRLLPIT